MKINRIWAIPNKWTFKIKPIEALLYKYVGDGKGWVDPFAGKNSPAEYTNDLNPDSNAKYHLEAHDFAIELNGIIFRGCLFDPPYSLRQLKECYNSIGIDKMSFENSKYFPNNVKNVLTEKIKVGGIVICCGWNTNGFGLKRGFEMIEILLVPHGGHHNDTIVTVEQKTQGKLF